jgi:hypothetical protein
MLKSIRGHGWRAENHLDIRCDHVRYGAQIIRSRFDDQAGLSFLQLWCAIVSGCKVKILLRGVSSPEGEACDRPRHLIDYHAAPTLLDAGRDAANAVLICDPNIDRRRCPDSSRLRIEY